MFIVNDESFLFSGESQVCTVGLDSVSSFPSTLLIVLFSSGSSVIGFLTGILSSAGFVAQGIQDLFPI